MSEVPIVREATANDARLVAAVIRRAFRGQVSVLGIRRSDHSEYVGFETADRVRRRLASGGRILVADVDGRPAGTVAFRLDDHVPTKGEIARLGVLPAFRGMGMGELLMKSAESALRRSGATVAEIGIVANFHRLCAYYEAMGYSPIRRRRFVELPFDVLFMEKEIPAPTPGNAFDRGNKEIRATDGGGIRLQNHELDELT